jgi:peptidoglycan/xylan/chitin deacetylase (PgdA/CDA1 family)
MPRPPRWCSRRDPAPPLLWRQTPLIEARMNHGAMFVLLLLFGGPAFAAQLVEPTMHLKPVRDRDGKHVALTLDACTGKADERILRALIDNDIKATLFVTARWLRRNPQAVARIKAHPFLFKVENHGARHVPAIDWPMSVFGLKAAGSPDGVRREVEDGAKAIEVAFGTSPRWYRGAAAVYSPGAEQLIGSLHFKIAGYSLAGDDGATYSRARAAKVIAAAQSGDVILAHLNQPNRPAGAGVVDGLLQLKAKGFVFVTLDDEE